MAVGIFTMLIAFIVLSINVWRGINTTPVLAWAVRLGMIVTAARAVARHPYDRTNPGTTRGVAIWSHHQHDWAHTRLVPRA